VKLPNDPADLNHGILLGVIALTSVLELAGVLTPTVFFVAMSLWLLFAYIQLLRIYHRTPKLPWMMGDMPVQVTHWFECPSVVRGQSPELLPDWEARCPTCGWTFTTVMDEPALPRHFIDGRGNVQLRPEGAP